MYHGTHVVICERQQRAATANDVCARFIVLELQPKMRGEALGPLLEFFIEGTDCI